MLENQAKMSKQSSSILNEETIVSSSNNKSMLNFYLYFSEDTIFLCHLVIIVCSILNFYLYFSEDTYFIDSNSNSEFHATAFLHVFDKKKWLKASLNLPWAVISCSLLSS